MAASTASTSAALSFARSSSIAGSSLNSTRTSSASAKPAAPIACRAQKSADGSEVSISRRSAVSLAAAAAAAVAAIATPASPAHAAYGEAANIFGAAKKDTGFIPFSGDGFKVDIPSKWNPSKEKEFPGTVLRYEDNFDANSNLAIMILPAEKPSIKDYGSPEKFLESVSYLLGKQAYSGNTKSECAYESRSIDDIKYQQSSVCFHPVGGNYCRMACSQC